MTQAKVRFTSIEEYAALSTSDLPEGRFELVDGVIVEMGAENDLNGKIAIFLCIQLAQFVPHYLLRRGTEVEVTSRLVTCREPDLMVLTEAANIALQDDERSLITLAMPNPALVIEIVSLVDPAPPNYQRDYVHKRTEYAARGISEYWLIDPSRHMILVLRLEDGKYQGEELQGNDCPISPTFPDLQLTAEQILNAGQKG